MMEEQYSWVKKDGLTVAKKPERDLGPQKGMEEQTLKGREGMEATTQPMEQAYGMFSPLMQDAGWPVGRPAVGLTPGRAPSIYPRSPVMDYPSPALSNGSPSYAHQAFMSEFPQLEPSIGPTRGHGGTTRSQGFSQKVLGRPTTLARPNGVAYSGAGHMLTGTNNDESTPLRHARPSLTIPSPVSPYDPMTPSSTPEPHAPFHSSRALSPRAPSPALSAASDLTTASAASRAPVRSSELLVRPRGKKRHLEDHDRKAICLYHQEHPQERQEDIGKEFDVERSTISKILKQKAKWLNIPDTPGVRVSKHRPSKFPEVEEELRKWVEECTARKMAISDNSIRERAREVAKALGIAPDKFKASSGWVENFKSRANIRGGMWHGFKKSSARIIDSASPDAAVSTSASVSPVPGQLSPMNPAYMSNRVALDVMSPQQELGTSPIADQHHAAPTSDAAPWSGADVTPSQPSPLSAHSVAAYAHLQQYHLVPPDTSSPQPTPEFIPPEHYGPRRVPTAAEAEEYIDALLHFIDRQSEDFISQEARDALHTVKVALFKESHGIL